MNKIILGDVANLRRQLHGPGLASALALMLLVPAAVLASDAKPTATEIAKARGECALQKQQVRKLEAANADDTLQDAARKNWEHACGHAQALIDAAEGRTPPPVVAPQPVVELPPPGGCTPPPPPPPAASSSPCEAQPGTAEPAATH